MKTAITLVVLCLFPMVVLESATTPQLSEVTTNLTSMPLAFTENQGQWDDEVLYRASAGGATMWFTEDGAVYQFIRTIPKAIAGPDDQFDPMIHIRDHEPDSIESISIRASFVGANLDPAMRAEDEMEYKCNYFIGNNPSEWHNDVSNYRKIVYEDIYSGIDLKYYGNGKQMEYDFIVSPGADPAQIEVKYEGAKSLSVNGDGELVVETEWGEVVEQKPIIYQIENGSRIAVDGEYKLNGDNSFGFVLNSNYDPALLLVIDPVLSYSTFLGGVTGGGGDYGNSITVDATGAAYIAGFTYSSSFPMLNPYQGIFQGYTDVFVTKLSSSGNSLVYSTYLGGDSQEYGNSITVDPTGAAYIAGFTLSSNFPMFNPYQGTYQGGDYDAYVTKLSSSGNSLVFSTYLGGDGIDYGNSIAVDATGAAYVTGYANSSNFPTLNPYQGTYQGGDYDAFVTKLSSSGNSLVYSTYLGGDGSEGGHDIAVDATGATYLTGRTYSSNFPMLNPYQGTRNGYDDAFVTKLSSSGNSLVYSTYLGSYGSDFGDGIAVDATGAAYVTGRTYYTDFPTLNPYQGTFQGGGRDAFVTKLSSSGSSLVYSTYLGGGSNDSGHDIAVDATGAAYVTGFTNSSNFPTLNPYQGTFQGNYDTFVTKLSSSGSSLVYSTYLGGSDYDNGYGITVDATGAAYVTGATTSTDFPTLNPYQGTFQGGYDAFVTKFSDNALPAFCDGFTGLFCDDFEDGPNPLWTTLTGSYPGSCTWDTDYGRYSTSQSGTEQLCIQSVLNSGWTNYLYEVYVRGYAGVDKEITFRTQDGLNTYDFNLIGDPVNMAELNKVEDGVSTNLMSEPFSNHSGTWYNIKVTCVDSTFIVYIDDSEILRYTDNDSPYLNGGIGLVNWTGSTGECDISFDNVSVSSQLPHIVFTDVSGTDIGEYLTISGEVRYADGSVFTPLSPGTIGCEDPLSQMSRLIAVDAGGSFSLTTNSPSGYPGLYHFRFGANYEGVVIYQDLFVPISEPHDPIHPPARTGLEIGVGTTKAYPNTNRAISVQHPSSDVLEFFAPLANEFYQAGKTSWQRTTTSPTGKLMTSLKNQAFDDCAWSWTGWGACVIGAQFQAVQIAQAGHPISVLRASFDNAWSGLRDYGYIDQLDVEYLGSLLDLTEVVHGAWKVNVSRQFFDLAQSAQGLADAVIVNAEILVKEVGLKDGSIEELLALVEDDEGSVYVVYIHPKWENMTRISSLCPVDIIVTNPEGLVVSKTVNEIPGAQYIEADFDNDGELEDQVLIPDTVFGQYSIEVVAEPGASDTATYSLQAENSYWTEGIVLAENELISDISPIPFEITTSENQSPVSFGLVGPGDTLITSLPISFEWMSTIDPDSGHTVLYDLLIAPDSLFNDTIVVYNVADPYYIFADTLPTDMVDSIFFWRVRAHDIWGAFTLSTQTYSFAADIRCCADLTGNVNDDVGDNVDISDLTRLVNYLFVTFDPLHCPAEANVSGDPGCSVDVSDVTALVNYLFVTFEPPAPCDPACE